MRNAESAVIEINKPLKKQPPPEFEKIFHLFNAALCFFARKWVNDTATAQDIVTDVFVKFWEKQDQFQTLYNAKAFLYISTRNACINHNNQVLYQTRIRKKIYLESDNVESEGINETIHAEVLRKVQTMMNDLPTKCREVMMLSYSNGMDCHEIARKMQLSVHTVRNQKNRGVHLIKNRFRVADIEAAIL